jgi:hypothetical protein
MANKKLDALIARAAKAGLGVDITVMSNHTPVWRRIAFIRQGDAMCVGVEWRITDAERFLNGYIAAVKYPPATQYVAIAAVPADRMVVRLGAGR